MPTKYRRHGDNGKINMEMGALKKEIREALLGDLVPAADGRLAVSFTRMAKYRNGLGDGYDKVRIFGVMCRRRWYLAKKNSKRMHELAVKGMQAMGRMMYISSDPDREAVYCSYLLNPPAILTYAQGEDGVIEVAAYSARGLSGWLACFRSLNRFQKNVPEVLQRMSEESERERQSAVREQDAQDKLQNRLDKKEKKQEKKRRRKDKRKARLQRIVGVLPKVPKLPLTDPNAEAQMRQHADEDQQAAGEMMNAEGMEQIADAAMNEAGMNQIIDTTPGTDGAQEDFTISTAPGGTSIDAMRAEQARLEAEAEKAKLAAQAAQAKLAAAQAKLEAEEAQAKLAEVEAQLVAKQEKPADNFKNRSKNSNDMNSHKGGDQNRNNANSRKSENDNGSNNSDNRNGNSHSKNNSDNINKNENKNNDSNSGNNSSNSNNNSRRGRNSRSGNNNSNKNNSNRSNGNNNNGNRNYKKKR